LRHLLQSIAGKRFVALRRLSFAFVTSFHLSSLSSSHYTINFKWHGVCVSGRVSRFYDTPVWASRFYRSLCYVVCVHGLVCSEKANTLPRRWLLCFKQTQKLLERTFNN
jgi:hypothetical protein